jgi:hypothetical protein
MNPDITNIAMKIERAVTLIKKRKIEHNLKEARAIIGKEGGEPGRRV